MEEKDYKTIVSILCSDYDYSVISVDSKVVRLIPRHYYVGFGALQLVISHGLSCSVALHQDGRLVLSIEKI